MMLVDETRVVHVGLLALEVLGHAEEQAELAAMLRAGGCDRLAVEHEEAARVLMADAKRIAETL